MKQLRTAVFAVTLFALLGVAQAAQANTTPQVLPFSQNWANTGLVTTDDNWAGVPGIVGYSGADPTTAATGTDPQTLLGDPSVEDVIANQSNPNALSSAGVAEFDALSNPVVALQGSGTADAPQLVFFLNTTGVATVTVAYNLRDIDGSADDTVQQFAGQYRVGSTGPFTNLPVAHVADATTGPTLATLVTPVSVVLPPAAGNQPLVEFRVMTTNAVGSDEWVGVDDIQVTASSTPDTDSDGIGDPTDNCALVANANQADIDGDGHGDACDSVDDRPPANTPSCTVPSVKRGAKIRAAKAALAAAGCTPGKVTPKRSKSVKRGRLIKLSPKPGSVLAAGAAVGIKKSSGKR